MNENNKNCRLLWNFEFSTEKQLPLTDLVVNEKDDLKWESRFFWPDKQIITLCSTDNSILDLSNYEQKYKDDDYFLIPGTNYNIKRRRNELLYKPIIKETPYALGFGHKINLEEIQNIPAQETNKVLHLQKIVHEMQRGRTLIHVQKEAFNYKFPTIPTIKLELARLELDNKVYFSACIEGRSRYLVETISEHLLGKQVSCDYVTFLKNTLRI